MAFFDDIEDLWERSFWTGSIFDEIDSEMSDLFRFDHEELNGKNKGYSMSYHYETGMKEPKITIQGDVDQRTVDKFLEHVQKTFHHTIPQLNNSKKESLPDTPQAKDQEKEVTLEMPGLTEKDVEIKLKKNYAIVKGKKGDRDYNFTVPLPFKAKRHEITSDNGLFTLKFFEK